jgi:hypothetical protein
VKCHADESQRVVSLSFSEATLVSHLPSFLMNNSSAKEPQPSYVKLAMRNMVRKGGTSLKHFALTAVGLLTVLVGLAYLTH